MKTILLTGFEPFGDVVENPSQQLVVAIERLGLHTPNFHLVTDILPVVYDEAVPRIQALIREHEPDLVLMFGVAARREKVNLERVALNLMDASIPDNTGAQPEGEQILQDAPLAYFSNLPLTTLRDHLEEMEIPVVVSNHAGAYLCNAVFYTAAHEIELSGSGALYGFIHIPLISDDPCGEGDLTVGCLATTVVGSLAWLVA